MKHGKFSLKYEVICHVRTGRLLWVSGGVNASIHDLTLSRLSGILQKLQLNECLMGDKGYIGENLILTPSRVALLISLSPSAPGINL